MDKITHAEFAESQDILDVLSEVSVDYVQGLLLGRPKPIGETSALPDPRRLTGR